jgi:Zn-dependent protease with chaperone function
LRLRPTALLALAVAVVLLAGCVERYKIRPIRPEEATLLSAASGGLLARVHYLGGRPDCHIGVAVDEANRRDLEVLPPTVEEDCMLVYATAPTLQLPPTELRALIAHGVAHLALGHERTTGRRLTASGRSATAEKGVPQDRIYSPAEEAEADRYAVRLLADGCPGLAIVLDRVRTEADRWTRWTEQHPLTPTRVAAARGFCASQR